jgi:hypothetical protein
VSTPGSVRTRVEPGSPSIPVEPGGGRRTVEADGQLLEDREIKETR